MERKFYAVVAIKHLFSGDELKLTDRECLSRSEAQAAIDELEKAAYMLAHNEYSPASYLIISQDAKNRLDRWEMDQFDWDGVECQGMASGATDDFCGQCKDCVAAMNEQLIEFAEAAAKNVTENNKGVEK